MVQQHAGWALFLVLVGCGADSGGLPTAESGRSVQAIEGAAPCGPHQFAETGAVLGKASWLGNSVCTGTLIAANAVLTAAHCLDPNVQQTFVLDPQAMRARAGSAFPVAGAVVHPGYRAPLILGRAPRTDGERAALAQLERSCGPAEGGAAWRGCVTQLPADLQRTLGMIMELSERHDLAILWLQTPVEGGTVARLPDDTDSPYLGMDLEIVGYGIHGSAGLLSPASGARYWGHTQVQRVGAFELASTGRPARACAGDSGAPAFNVHTDEGGVRRLVAVASQANYDADGTCVGSGIFQRVDVHVPWILRTLRQGAP